MSEALLSQRLCESDDILFPELPSFEGASYQCRECQHTFSRRDYLDRHLRAHIKTRPFACSECNQSFASIDLLLRHVALHNLSESLDSRPRPRRRKYRRVSKACGPCATAKVKCHDEKPCQRCRERGIHCASKPRSSPGFLSDRAVHDDWHLSTSTAPIDLEGSTALYDGYNISEAYGVASLTEGGSSANSSPQNTGGNTTWQLVSETGAVDAQTNYPCLVAPNASIFTPTNFALGDCSIFAPGDTSLFDVLEPPTSEPFTNDDRAEKMRVRCIALGCHAFRSSIWSSQGLPHHIPDTGTDSIPEQEIIATLLGSVRTSLSVRYFDEHTKDNLISFVEQSSPETKGALPNLLTEFPYFPSPAVMDILACRFLQKQDEKIDSWIHTASFNTKSAGIELVAAVMAAGAVQTPFWDLRRLGLRISKILHANLLERLAKGNESHLALQLVQALLIVTELFLWAGEDHNLRQAGALSRIIDISLDLEQRRKAYFYPTIAPHPDDEEIELQEKWRLWITNESYKRLTMRFYVFDNQRSMMLNVRTSTAFSEYRLPLPHPKSLWLAKTAAEWRNLYLSHLETSTPSPVELLASMPTISIPNGFVDTDLALKIAYFALGGMIIDHHLLAAGLRDRTLDAEGPSVTQFIHCRKEELKLTLRNLQSYFNKNRAAAILGPFSMSYLYMALAASLDSIELFFGKAGEDECRRVYAGLQRWVETSEAREAIWHAGQILRLFRLIKRPMSSFHVIMVYQAGLVLLAYSLLKPAREDGTTDKSTSKPLLFLNGTSLAQAEAFFLGASAQPALQGNFRGLDRSTASLRDPGDAVQVISEIILNKTSDCEELSQRLVYGLTKLLKELGTDASPVRDDSEAHQRFEF